MKIIVFLIIGLLFSCKKEEEQIEIFFYKEYISSHIPLTCNDFNVKTGSSVLKIYNDSLFKEIKNCIEISKINEKIHHDIDVRFKIILKNDTLCMDDFGRFILNNESYGKLNCYNQIINIVEDNHYKSSFIKTNVMDDIDIENN